MLVELQLLVHGDTEVFFELDLLQLDAVHCVLMVGVVTADVASFAFR